MLETNIYIQKTSNVFLIIKKFKKRAIWIDFKIMPWNSYRNSSKIGSVMSDIIIFYNHYNDMFGDVKLVAKKQFPLMFGRKHNC